MKHNNKMNQRLALVNSWYISTEIHIKCLIEKVPGYCLLQWTPRFLYHSLLSWKHSVPTLRLPYKYILLRNWMKNSGVFIWDDMEAGRIGGVGVDAVPSMNFLYKKLRLLSYAYWKYNMDSRLKRIAHHFYG